MLISPARLFTIVPTATSRIGALMPSVRPQRPGRQMLPLISARNTSIGDPPVAHTIAIASAIADETHTT
jgi:hypothetical protein